LFPTVFVSGGRWDDYADDLDEALRDLASAGDKSRALGRDLTRQLRTPEEKIVAIRDYVAKNIRAAGPPFTDLPRKNLSPADVTLKDGYGNGADRAIVTFAMLRGAGFKPEFVAASPFSRLEAVYKPLVDSPAAGLFDDMLIRVRVDKQTYYLNDTDQYAALGSVTHEKPSGPGTPGWDGG